ncbi:MAG TPA: hypothetical protein VK456_05325 [Xanthobacteraceae bacterium]|nr:hypothetical protein [Xanthobacteraceae bacterium]
MDLRPFGEHENEHFRQLGEEARRDREARAGGGNVAQVASADRFAVLGADDYVPTQGLPGARAAIGGHVRNLRYGKANLFAKKLTAGY